MSDKYTVLASYAQHMIDTGRHVAPFTSQEIVDLLAERDADKAQIAELDERLLRYAGIATRRAEHVAELEKRNAELEARTVKLPAAWWVKQGSQSFLAYEKQLLLDALNAAGINLETGGE